jgi:hypothetical protein
MNLSNSSNYFHIKNLFSIYFLWFSSSLDWASNTVKRRGSGEKEYKTQAITGLDRGLIL